MTQAKTKQKKKTSIKKNFTYQMLYEILVLLLPLILSPYVSRVIGAEGLGIYSYSYSVAYYFVLVSMLGIKNYGNRVIAQTRDDQDKMNEAFSGLVTIHIAVSLLCVVAYFVYCAVTKEANTLYALLQTPFVISALFDISWFYFGVEEFRLTVIRNAAIKILTFAAVLVLVKDKDDLSIYCLIMSVGFLVSQLALWIPLKKYVRFVRPSVSDMKRHIKPLLILFIPAIAVSLYKFMDKIMIGDMSSKLQLGFYENAEKVVNIPLTIIVSFGTVMLPKMSNLASKKDAKATQRYIDLSMQFVMCMAYALGFGLAGAGLVFAPVFWGAEFEPSGVLIIGLAITIPFMSFANVIRTQHLIPNEKDREYVISVIAGAVVNLIINIILIPAYGAFGAMIGTVAAEAAVCIIQSYYVREQLPVGRYLAESLPFFAAGAVMFAMVLGLGFKLGTSISTLLIQILAGAVFYSAVSLLIFLKRRNEVILQLLERFKRILNIG